jgi:hypothetical protein
MSPGAQGRSRGFSDVPHVYVDPGGARPTLRGNRELKRSVSGEIMGKEARVALLLAGTACLLAVMADWVVEELR